MIFTETSLRGAFVIDIEGEQDDRGWFGRTFCQEEFKRHRLNPDVAQCNLSRNWRRGTLRGMHYQAPPHQEAKLVRCTRGALYDVIIDLRSESQTFCHWHAVELTADNHRMVYVPEGLAHGFLSLNDNTEVFYQMTRAYARQNARGVRWDDPAFGISWPYKPEIISEADRSYPDFRTSELQDKIRS